MAEAGSTFSIATGPDTSVDLTMDGDEGEMIEAAGTLEISIKEFLYLQGDFAVKSSTQTVTLNNVGADQVEVEALSIGANGVDLFAGVNRGEPTKSASTLPTAPSPSRSLPNVPVPTASGPPSKRALVPPPWLALMMSPCPVPTFPPMPTSRRTTARSSTSKRWPKLVPPTPFPPALTLPSNSAWTGRKGSWSKSSAPWKSRSKISSTFPVISLSGLPPRPSPSTISKPPMSKSRRSTSGPMASTCLPGSTVARPTKSASP